jgi:ABC-type branched-subunit amino acid transport system ATPase component
MTSLLQTRGLVKSFGGIRAADHLDLTFEPGKITGLIGPNGAGKTTFFNLVTGYIPPDEGQVLWDGRDVTGKAPHHVSAAGVIRTWQDLRLYMHMTVLQNVMVARPAQPGERLLTALVSPRGTWRAERHNRARSMAILERVGLWDKRNTTAADLSFAEQKLLSIARALATDARCYLFDEPLAGLDEESSEVAHRILRELAASGLVVCLVEHIMDSVVNVCEEVVFLNQGALLAQGTPADVMANEQLAELYFGADA